MRVYANLIHKNLALFDLPIQKQGQSNKYLEKIFRQLLVYDQLPDDDYSAVLHEAIKTASVKDFAFRSAFHDVFEQYILRNKHHAKWQKISKDYNTYIDWETNRRNKENPYYVVNPKDIGAWDLVPNFSKQIRNRPYQFDALVRDSQILSGQVYELTKDYQEHHDKDLFRAKVNSILVPEKIIFALSGTEDFEFSESQISIVNLKITLEAYKLASVYLNRLIESVYKLKWSYSQQEEVLEKTIELAGKVNDKLKARIIDAERSFMLYLDADFSEE